MVPREGFALDLIRSGGLKGKSLVARARGAALVPIGLVDAWRIVTARRPDLVIGVGGYSSGPVVLVAALRGVPTMVLEQNAVPGLTNRMLSRYVQAAAVSYESTRRSSGRRRSSAVTRSGRSSSTRLDQRSRAEMQRPRGF